VATAWLAPLLVDVGTEVTGTQQGGFATIILLLALGLGGLFFVRGAGREGVAEESTAP
jgi:UMF1 family MFS transporter